MPSSIASDLSGLRVIPLRENHDCKACRQELRLVTSDDESDGFTQLLVIAATCSFWYLLTFTDKANTIELYLSFYIYYTGKCSTMHLEKLLILLQQCINHANTYFINK